MTHIAALYVETDGVYFNREDITPYDINNDARRYKGPHPIIAHPPCKRWGRYWSGGPSARVRRLLGDDDGCFAHSLWSARTFGGVIEHPADSYAWKWHGINKPPRDGGWVAADGYGGLTCRVEQGHYGHRARKATWLLAYQCRPPELIWGPSSGERMDEGFHSKEERARARARGNKPIERLSAKQRLATPENFANLLIDIVRTHTC